MTPFGHPGLLLAAMHGSEPATQNCYTVSVILGHGIRRMKRRDFITLLGGTAAWPLTARAQEPGRTYRIGFLIPSPRDSAPALALFVELRLHGFVEGQNLFVIPGGFDVPNDIVAERAAALVKAAPDVVIAGPEIPVQALQAATRTVPIVAMVKDMVLAGLVP
jgi:putative ABC transport system substrate-binding protein